MVDDPQKRKPNISKAMRELNWRPQVPFCISAAADEFLIDFGFCCSHFSWISYMMHVYIAKLIAILCKVISNLSRSTDCSLFFGVLKCDFLILCLTDKPIKHECKKSNFSFRSFINLSIGQWFGNASILVQKNFFEILDFKIVHFTGYPFFFCGVIFPDPSPMKLASLSESWQL